MDLFILGDGHSLLLVWPDGFAERLVTENPDEPVVGETLRLVGPGRRVTALAKLIGGRTIVVGDSAGGVSGWFSARNELARTPDQLVFSEAHRLAPQGAAITSIGVSTRDRTIVTGDDSGAAWVRNVTAQTVVARVRAEPAEPIAAARLAPKVDGLALLTASGALHTWSLDAPHPDASVRALFGKVWYEGDPAPSHTYQSSSGDDAAEAKYNLVPLIFGTLKATIYTMLIAAPLGILGAIYTSEFLSPRVRAAVKPSIEMMASLPSVVLGFIAAMLIAPLVRDALPGVLLAFAGVPIGVLLAAYLWHFAPVRVMSRLSAGGRLATIMAVTAAGAWASLRLGPTMESALFRPSEADVLIRAGAYEPVPRDEWPAWFAALSAVSDREVRRLREAGLSYRDGVVVRPAGTLDDPEIAAQVALHGFDEPDLRAWLDGVIGGPWPGWFLLLFPAAALAMAVVVTRVVDPAVRAWDRRRGPAAEAAVELAKFLLALGATAALAAVGASALAGLGLDARDSIFGAYQQRNTLVVGLAMAVAVIPIIYTIADDAMTSVPDSMRSASLGCGATRWQTAVRVVLPVALSGVFSACMIGLGRAAGETMIVLMATGNTPIMSWSLFDGLRTLSANIAVELPEAPKDGTHYRVLFLCGLALFALTFTINTAAELIRQRVRRRSASL
ncbi:MAG: ABC transporter permease subunit [Planctomycetota bacterium]|nr:MAG: ABC transporter permease subunit [Planctomycetota bacterium]